MKTIPLCLTLVYVIFACGCATPPSNSKRVASTDELPQIEDVYSKELSNVKAGVSIEELKKIFPDAHLAGMEDGITIYEVSSIQKYVTNTDISRQNWLVGFGSPNPHTHKQILQFHFTEDGLKKWDTIESD